MEIRTAETSRPVTAVNFTKNMMNPCKQCGRPTSNTKCPDCRYRNGGKLLEGEERERVRDVVEEMARHSAEFFGVDNPQQPDPSEP